MSLHIVRMPDLGEGIAEVELVAWRVQPGDRVAEDQILVDVMTDKATIEVPSSVTGTVLALGGEAGQVLAVGAELIRIDEDDGATAAVPSAAPAARTVSAPPPPAAPMAAGQPTPAAASTTPASTPAHERPVASPAVRARAWELGVDLAQLRGTGPAGRVVHADLDAFVAGGGGRSAPRAAPVRPAAASDATQTIKVIGLRRKIAQKMQESKRRIPHYAYVEEVDVTEVEALREHLNAKWQGQRAHLTPLAFIVRAMALAAAEFPQVNAVFDDEVGVLTRHAGVHVGVATQTEFGLLVPVLRDAQALDLWGIASEAARVAAVARSGKAARSELTGSTITVTSLGKLGGIVTTPVINHPEVAIIGVNKIAERAVIRSGAVVPRLIMNLSSSFDHRVIDGAVAAAFVQCVRERLEHPATLFVD
jgi:2-oxoisovalerate dehydrogenase E2 component (dihydrolipoyl transacylase)